MKNHDIIKLLFDSVF